MAGLHQDELVSEEKRDIVSSRQDCGQFLYQIVHHNVRGS